MGRISLRRQKSKQKNTNYERLMETLFEKRPTIKNNRCDKINDNENDSDNENENENENNVENDNDSDDEIESISSTCTWALNYKLPARYVYGKKDENITTVVEEKKLLLICHPLHHHHHPFQLNAPIRI